MVSDSTRFTSANSDLCDVRATPSAICVVQEPKDIQAIEGARVFRGRYHARLVDAINAVRGRVRHCDICGNLTEEDQCSICRDVRATPSAICVVQEPKDIQAIEGARVFRGRYHAID